MKLIFLTLLPFLLSCASQSPRRIATVSSFIASEREKLVSPLVFTSDFGIQGDGVAIVKGIILRTEPNAKVVDLTHQIVAFSVRDASRFIYNTAPYFPPGTVFLTLVDRSANGRSTKTPSATDLKKPIVMKSKKGQYFVQPDNGTITKVAERDGIEAIREITPGNWVTAEAFFPGRTWRDVYPPVAARLSRNEDFKEVGPLIEKFVRLPGEKPTTDGGDVRGNVVALDRPFGNLITNITSAVFLEAGHSLGDKVITSIDSKQLEVPFVRTFDDVPVNEPLLYVDSTDHIALAINQGNFATKYKIHPPQKIQILKKMSTQGKKE